MEGWTVHISGRLLAEQSALTERALALLKIQLEEIIRVVPKAAVAELQKVPLWISPEYPGVTPRAEYHPDARWLGVNGRDPVMVKGVEFTNVRIRCALRLAEAIQDLRAAASARQLGIGTPLISWDQP